MKLEIRNSLEDLFSKSLVYSKSFNKYNYEDAFRTLLAECTPALDALDQMWEQASEDGERDAILQEAVLAIAEPVESSLSEAKSKRAKENLLMNYNMALVTFTIPVICYPRKECLELLADQIIARWNTMDGITRKVGKSTYEQINGGFRNRLCYITTAVCRYLSKPDNCYELTMLRRYRDEYLVQSEQGQNLIAQYYDIAPTIVKRIDRMEQSGEIYRAIWEKYLRKCISQIESNQLEDCLLTYTQMVKQLRDKYLYI